jgi:hypothetical protein
MSKDKDTDDLEEKEDDKKDDEKDDEKDDKSWLRKNGQLEMGTEHELEHGPDRKLARKIAMDHLKEHPDYYTRLKAAGL